MIDLVLALQVAVWLTVLGVFLAGRQASVYHPVTWYLMFHGLVFVLRPVLVHYLGFDSIWEHMLFWPKENDIERTLLVTSVALVVFTGASLSAGRARLAFATVYPPRFSASERQGLIATTLLLLPLVAYSIYFTRAGQGSLGERAPSGVFIMTNSVGYINEAQNLMAPLFCAWLLVTRFHWLNAIPAALYVGYRAWYGWSRWTILLFLLMVTIAYCWQRRRMRVPAWSMAVAMPVLVLFNVLGHNRDYLRDYLKAGATRVLVGPAGQSPWAKLKSRLDTQDFANFDYLTYVVAVVPARTGTFTFGVQYLQLFTEPIPRLLWKAKPTGVPVRTIDVGAYGNFLGLTVSLPGDGWISGGWFGLVVTMVLAGTILGRFHQWFWRNSERPLAAIFYISGLAVLPQWYRDGGISIAKFLLFVWFPLLLWLCLTRLLSRGFRARFKPSHRRFRYTGRATAPGSSI